jgi:sulfate/thiosulfate-binding protein
LGALGAALGAGCSAKGDPNEILNVSFDPTRELYAEYNALFAAHWAALGNPTPKVVQSHGGSGKQARAVIDGIDADVVTLALGYDIDVLAERRLVARGWRERLPDRSAPFTSAIVFLVRGGNPKSIRDWDDLARGDVAVITPNPKTSGGARWNYLAAWGYELRRSGGDEAKAQAFVEVMFRRVPVLDSGARAATTTFVERKIGDVLIAWESEAMLAAKKLSAGSVEIVTPPTSIAAEPPVAVVDAIVDYRGTRGLAEAYLQRLWEDDAQRLGAKHFYRPRGAGAAPEGMFRSIELFTIDEIGGGWQQAQPKHFADGGIFDRIYEDR